MIGRVGPLLARTDRSEFTADDEGVALRARGLQIAHVAGVEQVEHAVREDDARAAARVRLGECGGVAMREHAGATFFLILNLTLCENAHRCRGR